MHDDLVRRLRLKRPTYAQQAADIITTQSARIEKLEEALRTIRDNKVQCPRAADCRAIANDALVE